VNFLNTDEIHDAALRVARLAAEVREIATLLHTRDTNCDTLLDYARVARDNLDNLSIELQRRCRHQTLTEPVPAETPA
jgi:hypothetical protein